MRIALLGSAGQLAHDLTSALSEHELILFSHGALDVTDHKKACDILTAAAPDAVINTTAYHKVDECEGNAEKAFAVNAAAPLNLARICRDLQCRLVHISTNYVFDGTAASPYAETACPMPLNVYGNSKLAGEHFVRSTAEQHLVIRTAGLYGIAGSSGKGGNFVEMILKRCGGGERLQIVADQTLTPTFTRDLAIQMKALLQCGATGLFHMTNAGECSWFEFASSIRRLAGLRGEVVPVDSAAYVTPAVRPLYGVLENREILNLGVGPMRPWMEALAAYLKERAKKSVSVG